MLRNLFRIVGVLLFGAMTAALKNRAIVFIKRSAITTCRLFARW